MKTELFERINRNYRATRYIEKNKREERENAITLLIFMVLLLVVTIMLVGS